MTETMAESGADPKPAGSPWTRVFWVFVILVVSGLAVFFSFIWLGNRTIDATRETVVELFRPRVIVKTFHEWKELEVEGNEGNILEVATAQASEEFTRKTNIEWFGKIMPLGTNVSEIRVPATYRYHIDLAGEWFLESDGRRLMVIAPALQPSLPVAFDTGGMEKKSKRGWGRWDSEANLEELERSLTSRLNERAGHERTIARVRDEGRVAVAKFLQTWLVAREGWGEGRFEEIVVKFEDEKDLSLMSAPATLRLESRAPSEGAESEPAAPLD